MRLLLMRHGSAVDPSVAGDDHRRWLTDEGRQRVRTQCARLAELGSEPEVILSSPLVRAVQTAELMASGCSASPRVRVASELHPSLGTTGDVTDALALLSEQTVLCVGHEPSIRVLASHLAGASLPIFRTGMIVAVNMQAGTGGSCEWWLDPYAEPALIYP